MAIALVAHIGAGSTNASTFTSGSIDTSGSSVLVFGEVDDNASGAVSDSKGNTWTAATTATTSAGVDTRIYYATNVVVGSGHTFTITVVSKSPSLFIGAFSGSNTSAPKDQSNQTNGFANTTLQPGSITPTTDNQVVVTVVGYDDATNALSINGGFTISDQLVRVNSQHFGGGMAYLIQTTAAAANPTWSEPAGNIYSAAIASFKAASAAATLTARVVNVRQAVNRAGTY